MEMEMSAPIPILRIFDVNKAKLFYLDFLGFDLDWEHQFDARSPYYLQVSRGKLVLHLSEHHGDGCPGTVVFVRMQGLEDYHREISGKNYGAMRPGIEAAPCSARVMEVIDPFGNRLRFSETLPE